MAFLHVVIMVFANHIWTILRVNARCTLLVIGASFSSRYWTMIENMQFLDSLETAFYTSKTMTLLKGMYF